jgi:hypothetical protein
MELMSEQKIRAIYSGKIFLRTANKFWETAMFFLIYSGKKKFNDSHTILGNWGTSFKVFLMTAL